MASVEPAAGSTVSTMTARNAKPMSALTGRRAPREVAAIPASTPAQPTIIAIHIDTTVAVAEKCSGCHHGGWAAPCTTGTDRLGPPNEITIMIRTDTTIAVRAAQAVSWAGRAGGRTWL